MHQKHEELQHAFGEQREQQLEQAMSLQQMRAIEAEHYRAIDMIGALTNLCKNQFAELEQVPILPFQNLDNALISVVLINLFNLLQAD